MTVEDTKTSLDSMLHTWDYMSAAHDRVKWEIFGYARGHCPVARTEEGGGFWLVTRFDDVKRVLEDWETFSSTESAVMPTPMDLCPITDDPPVQTAARQLLNPLFSRGAVAKWEPAMRAAARALIANWIDRGSVELLAEFSGPYVADVLTAAIFPDFGPDDLARAASIALRSSEDPSPQVFIDLFGLCVEYLAKVRERGVTEDGVVYRLLNGTFDGKPIPEEKQLGMLGILMLGGLDTTRGAIGNIAYRVATTPGAEDRLRDPAWVRRDLDEFLRLDSPVSCMARVATRDVELNGALIKAGERLQVRYDSANRDESRFHHADTLVFDEIRSGHAAFGFGVHRCVGSNLARLQIEVAFDELLKQIRNLRLAPDTEIVWMPGNTNALGAVHLEFDRIG
ncbi:MAG TPA: cytochrome P450 [Trebonia sp.]|jgi:cytochrome P450|nr:cytochrome P450 [Trebonia sp.]